VARDFLLARCLSAGTSVGFSGSTVGRS
jgi:hypothetical protein